MRTAIRKPVARDIAEGLTKRTADAFKEMFGFDVKKLTDLPPALQKITIAAHNLLGLDMQKVLGVFDVFENVRAGIAGWIGTLDFSGVKASISEGVGSAIQWFLDNWPKIKSKATEVVRAILDYDWSGLWTKITTAFGNVIQWFRDHWEPDIKPIILGAFTWVREYDWKGLWDTVTKAGKVVIDWFVKNWPKIKDTVKETYNDIVDFLFGPMENVNEIPLEFGGELQMKRVGGFVDGLISGFDTVKLSIDNAADSIRTKIIPNLQEAIINIAEMFGMEEGATPQEAGAFVAEKIAATIELYTELYGILSEIVKLLSDPVLARPLGMSLLPDPIGSFPEIPKGATDFLTGKSTLGEGIAASIDLDWWNNIGGIIGGSLSSAANVVGTWITDTIAQFLGLDQALVSQSIIPDMMDAIVNVFRTGLAEVGTLWSGFWTTMISGTDTSLDAFLTTMGVEGGASGGLLGAIADSLPEFFDAGEDIIGAISDGMMAASHLMVAALKSNVVAMNVAVSEGGDKGILGVLDKIGLKIVIRIKNSIIKSYQIILDALEFAMSLGGGLINQARAAANEVRNGAGEATGGAVTNAVDSAGQAQRIAQPTPYMQPPVEGPPRRYGVQGEQAAVVTVGPNYVRDDMDMVSLENTVRQVVSEEVRQ